MKKPLLILEEDPSMPQVSLPALIGRIRNLFPEQNLLSIPCVSARLFACFTIVSEDTSEDDTERPVRRRGRISAKQQPLWPLLKALVLVEETSLGRIPQSQGRKVHFSGFDCSSTAPPVESILGSQHHWEASIHAMEKAVTELHALTSSANENHDLLASLQQLVTFLSDLESESGALMRVECSRSMPGHWPPERIKKPAEMYRQDFENVMRLLRSGLETPPHGSRSTSIVISVEKQLSEFLGQAIRFYLRQFFNPAPLKVSTPPTLTVQEKKSVPMSYSSKKRSRISELVSMTLPEGVAVDMDSAIADGSISSIVSAALQCIHSYFGMEGLLSSDEKDVVVSVPEGFCTSEASQRCLPTRRSQEPITDEELQAIVDDVCKAQSFQNAAHACRFLRDLMKCPGVQEEIKKVGGWTLVEEYAKKLCQYDLLRCCSDDVHFSLLCNVELLLQRIDRCYSAMEPSILRCQQSLAELSIRFKCGVKSKKLREKHPQIEIIADTLEEGNSFVFPIVSAWE